MSTSPSHGPETSLSSDNLIPVSLRVPLIFSASRAEGDASQLVDKTRIALFTRCLFESALTSNMPAVESQDRLWEVEKILQVRTARGRGVRVKRAKRYLVQWTPSWLSTEDLRYARKTWKIVKTSWDRHSDRGGTLGQNKVLIFWAPSWVSAVEAAPILEV